MNRPSDRGEAHGPEIGRGCSLARAVGALHENSHVDAFSQDNILSYHTYLSVDTIGVMTDEPIQFLQSVHIMFSFLTLPLIGLWLKTRLDIFWTAQVFASDVFHMKRVKMLQIQDLFQSTLGSFSLHIGRVSRLYFLGSSQGPIILITPAR